MILTNEEAKTKLCVVFLQGMVERMRDDRFKSFSVCLGSDCMTYWKWIDIEHTKGYCSIAGKPEFE